MKIILYMAISADGFIASSQNETLWSEEEWQNYKKIVTETGNLIIGRRTYELMKKNNEFQNIGNPLTIVVCSAKSLEATDSQFVFVETPQEALKVLLEKGFDTALIGGGQKLNSSFLKMGLVNEMYLDVEPFVFGTGVALFNAANTQTKLKLIEINRYGKNAVQIHYAVEA